MNNVQYLKKEVKSHWYFPSNFRASLLNPVLIDCHVKTGIKM